MMQSSSLLCSSNLFSPLPHLSTSQRPTVAFRSRCVGLVSTSSCFYQLPLNSSHANQHALSPLHSTAMQVTVETSKTEPEFVEIGYICNVHGLQGEVRVKPSTDFPELRFSKPGRRWLRQQFMGRSTIQEVELVEGRGGHPGQKSWIVRFREIDTVDQVEQLNSSNLSWLPICVNFQSKFEELVDNSLFPLNSSELQRLNFHAQSYFSIFYDALHTWAQQLVGSIILVREEDRPELEEGEFYTRDLVGMRVILKETGEPVGTVVNVFDSGASDLLHVMLNSSTEMPDGTGKQEPNGGASAPLVWVPFVEAIVPNVDINRREMLITPPKGLLELNIRSDERSKKERRQLEWKQRKKFQQRLIAAKKKLCEMEQKHVFHGFRFGEKAQTSLLADQIVGVKSKLLQQALQNFKIPSDRWNLPEFITGNLAKQVRSTLRISEECLATGRGEKLNANSELQEKGHLLTSSGKVAIALAVDDSEMHGSVSDPNLVDSERMEDSSCLLLQKLLCDVKKFVKIEDRASVPLILVCPAHTISSLKKLFSSHDHFAFNSEKVWFLEEEKLPVVSNSLEEQNKHKILMKSPWEILQTPVGSGGVVSLLSSNNILENLSEMGVEYIEVCSVNETHVGGRMLLGLVNSCEAHVGIRIFKDMKHFTENFHLIFSMKFMKKLTKQIDKLHFHAIPKPNSHVEKVDKDWVDVIPSLPNSYEFHCSIYSSLNACPLDKVCAMEITE